MNHTVIGEKRSDETRVLVLAICAALALATALLIPGPLHRWLHESFMESVTSSHYMVRFPAGAISPDIMRQFAIERESLFTALNRKLDDAASNNELTLVFDSPSSANAATSGVAPSYVIYGTTIQTTLDTSSGAPIPHLDPAADATALLRAAWGKPGNPQVAYWTALWLVGQWRGQELGMAAAMVEQRAGYKNVASLLSQPLNGMIPQDRDLLAAAWLSEVAEFGGAPQVRKLYSANVPKLDIAQASAALGSTRPELERKWQLWLYSYVAGMPAGAHQMALPAPQ